MFCENGISLVRESQSNMINAFNNKLIDEIVKEINNDSRKLVSISNDMKLDKNDPSVRLSIKILFDRIQRNKRCVLIYLNNRIDKFQKLAWESGNLLPQQIMNNMDDRDKKYFDEYNKLINKFCKNQALTEMNLIKDFTPPKDLFVEVRALEDLVIQEKGEQRKIEKNQSYLLKRSDVEIYLRRGYFVLNE